MWQRWNQTTHIFENSNDNGANWTPAPMNASMISEGVLANARMFNPHLINYTPSLTGSGGGTPTYTERNGYYANLGGFIFVAVVVAISAKNALAGNLSITPPVVCTSNYWNLSLGFCANLVLPSGFVPMCRIAGSTNLTLFKTNFTTGAGGFLDATEISNTARFELSGIYY